MMKILRLAGLYGLLVLAFIGALYAMDWAGRSEPSILIEESMRERADLVRVDTLEIVPRPYQETILVPGMVEAKDDVLLGASIAGILEKKFIEEGQVVEKGEELFQIDLRERSARLKEVQSAHDLALTNLKRMEALYNKGNIPRQDYDDAVAHEEQTRAALERMKVELSLGVVKAPIQGIIDKVYVQEGEYMHEGGELARLINLNRIELKAGIAERYADAVEREREGWVYIEALSQRFPVSVKRVAFGGHLQTNTFEVTVEIENPERRIRPGMMAVLHLIVRQTDDALLIPVFSVIRSEHGMIVFVEEENRVEQRLVELGSFHQDEVEVHSGLQAHDRVVVTGQKELVSGQAVQVMQAERQKASL